MTRTLIALAAATMLVAPAVAGANLESETVQTYDPLPIQTVQAPSESRPFGLPNVSEFAPEPSTRGSVEMVPYAHDPISDRDDGD